MKNSKLILFSALFLLSLIVVCGSYWYTHFYLHPNNILLRSLLHINTIESFSYTGNIHLVYDLSDEEKRIVKEPLTFSSGFTGLYKKQKDEETPRVSFSGTVNAGDKTMSEFESRTINKKSYIRISSLADIGFIDISKVLDQWISVDLTKLPVSLSSLFIIPFWQLDENTIIQNVQKQSPITVVEVLNPEILDGIPVYHYRYHINSENLNSLFAQSSTTIPNVEFADGEVWVNQRKEEIVELTFSVKRKDLEKEAPQIVISGLLQFTDINKPVTIDPPESSAPFENFIQNSLKM
jgi:hypothetical protein